MFPGGGRSATIGFFIAGRLYYFLGPHFSGQSLWQGANRGDALLLPDKNRERTGKKDLQACGIGRISRKRPTPVVGQKPNGKSRINTTRSLIECEPVGALFCVLLCVLIRLAATSTFVPERRHVVGLNVNAQVGGAWLRRPVAGFGSFQSNRTKATVRPEPAPGAALPPGCDEASQPRVLLNFGIRILNRC